MRISTSSLSSTERWSGHLHTRETLMDKNFLKTFVLPRPRPSRLQLIFLVQFASVFALAFFFFVAHHPQRNQEICSNQQCMCLSVLRLNGVVFAVLFYSFELTVPKQTLNIHIFVSCLVPTSPPTHVRFPHSHPGTQTRTSTKPPLWAVVLLITHLSSD